VRPIYQMDIRKIKARVSLEKDIESYFKNSVQTAGGWPIKFWPLSLAGFPDRIVIWNDGRVHFVELKRPNEKPRPLQRRIHDRLRKFNCFVAVISDKEQVARYIAHHSVASVSD